MSFQKLLGETKLEEHCLRNRKMREQVSLLSRKYPYFDSLIHLPYSLIHLPLLFLPVLSASLLAGAEDNPGKKASSEEGLPRHGQLMELELLLLKFKQPVSCSSCLVV